MGGSRQTKRNKKGGWGAATTPPRGKAAERRIKGTPALESRLFLSYGQTANPTPAALGAISTLNYFTDLTNTVTFIYYFTVANIKTPLLSLGAHGSVSDAITFTRRRSQNIVEKKPELPYFLTLPVQYQRWLYEDYAHLWTQQTPATKQVYRSTGIRYHLTGFQYWMKYQLTNLPDILAWWKFDVNRGPTTPDSSRNANTGTIIGASPAIGVIDLCLSFDGVNDVVNVAYHPSINPLSDISIEAFIYPLSWGEAGTWGRVFTQQLGKLLMLDLAGRLEFGLTGVTGSNFFSPPGSISLGSWQHVYVDRVRTTGLVRFWINGLFINSIVGGNEALAQPLLPITIGNRWIGDRTFEGRIDNLVIRDAVLPDLTILRHSLRRWP